MSNSSQTSTFINLVVNHYLQSGGFNGFGVARLNSKKDIAAVSSLILNRSFDLVRGDGHPNPHIKAFDAEPVKMQLEKIEISGLEGCLYPTPELLSELNAGSEETAPYTRALMLGSPQLSHHAFDLRALEWYRNDPRFEFDTNDIQGRILQVQGTQVDDSAVVRDRLDFFEFGFAYDREMNRAFAAFIRYLHNLPTDQQIEMQSHELQGDFTLHPDFYRTSIMGKFSEKISIYDAFLEEKQLVNRICDLIRKPRLFQTEFSNSRRPPGFGILLRPTKKEFWDFSLLLDKILSDDLDRKFFKGDIELNRQLTDEAGSKISQPKGTIQLLEEWLGMKFKPNDPSEIKEMLANFRFVRKARQKPAHRAEDNVFDQKFLADQRELIVRAFDAVRTLRMVLENFPQARKIDVPDYLREAKVWTF